MIEIVARLGQRVPERLRIRVLRSVLAPPLRRVLNRFGDPHKRLIVVPVGGPIKGHRMLLDWQTHKAFVYGVYEHQVVRTLLSTIQAGWVAVDVGAHIGYYSLLLRKLVGASGRVVAFEPWPDVASILKCNAGINRYADIKIEQMAVADRSGTLRMRRKDHDPLTSVSSLDPDGEVEVRSVALDDYFAPNERISFIKIDVEGAECLVLKGMQRILLEQHPVLVVAVHGYQPDHSALRLLEGQRYRIRIIDTWGAEHHVLATPL